MDPKNVKISELFGSFTGPDWYAFVAAVVVGVGAIAGAGYWVGHKITVTQSAVEIVELKGNVSQLQVRLETNQSRIEMLSGSIAKLEKANQELLSTVSQKNGEATQLTAQLSKSQNCAFVHDQIRATRHEIANLNGMGVWEHSRTGEEKQNAQIAVLEKRLGGYQLQLGICNK